MKVVGFDWDGGNRDKCQKHGVSMEVIESLFADDHLYIGPDIANSKREKRFRAIGKALNGRDVFLVFTLRHRAVGILIRPISARYMHKKEVTYYEKEIS